MSEIEGLWTPDEVSAYLKVPKETLYRWSYLGVGPKVGRVGKHLRYDPADVRTWFEQQKRAAA